MLAYVRSLAPHGFDTFLLLSSHGGNFDALAKAAQRLREEFEPRGITIIDFAGRPALMETMRVMVETAAALGAPQEVDAIAGVCARSRPIGFSEMRGAPRRRSAKQCSSDWLST